MWMNEEELESIPHTRHWLNLAFKVKETVLRRQDTDDDIERERITEQINIVQQMNHLVTYPGVKERYRKGKLNIYGWYYIIGTGEVFNYSRDRQDFEKI